MEFWPNFLSSRWGREFVVGGCGGIAGIVDGYPLDTLKIRQQHPSSTGSALGILRNAVASEGPFALYRGMAAPLASIAFQNAVIFQVSDVLSRVFDPSVGITYPPSYRGVTLGGVGTWAIQSLMLSPIELVKIRLQLKRKINGKAEQLDSYKGPFSVTKSIFRTEGWRGIYRGLTITVLRDAPSYGFYFWTYEYMKEQLHPGCRKSGQESFRTVLVAGGLVGVTSWVCCYPLDVIKTRLQAQSQYSSSQYNDIIDCFRQSV